MPAPIIEGASNYHMTIARIGSHFGSSNYKMSLCLRVQELSVGGCGLRVCKPFVGVQHVCCVWSLGRGTVQKGFAHMHSSSAGEAHIGSYPKFCPNTENKMTWKDDSEGTHRQTRFTDCCWRSWVFGFSFPVELGCPRPADCLIFPRKIQSLGLRTHHIMTSVFPNIRISSTYPNVF